VLINQLQTMPLSPYFFLKGFITLFDGEGVTENLVDGMVGVGHVGDIRRIK
jgi:hypothetical protein